jgi:branched-chain amino acid transport system substrate-binding protein
VISKRWRTALAAGVIASFVMAACGSDDESSSTTAAATTTGGAATTAAGGAATTTAGSAKPAGTAPATTPGSTGTTPGTSGGGTGGAASVEPGSKEAAPAGVGLVDGVYKGTSGFEIDPADCPQDWDPKQGISDTEIKLFTSLPTSGPFAGFGLLADGAKAYFKHINDNGGIDGRSIVVDTKDDGYQPDKTKTNVDEAMGSGNYASLFVTLGTPNNLAVWDATNDECMPQLLNGTGAAQWGDVEGHPWTTGMQLDYFTEASLWAKWLEANKPKAKVAELTFNSDFGHSYTTGFAFATKGTDIQVVAKQEHEPTAPNLDNQFTTLAASGADVLLLETSGAFCTQAMANVEKQTAWKPLVIMSGTCGSLNQFFKPLIDQGLTGRDTQLIQNFKDVNDPALQSDPIVQLYQKVMQEQGLDYKVTTYFTGWIFAWYMADILKNAATYEGGLDRGNIMLAARNIHETSPMLIDGLNSITDGTKDAYLTEGGRMVKYTVTDPTALGSFVQVGDLINLEGQLGTYKTVQEAAVATGAGPTTTTG